MPFVRKLILQVDQRGFKVLAYCNEHDSVDEQHQWREVRKPVFLQHPFVLKVTMRLTFCIQVRFSFNDKVETLDEVKSQLAKLQMELNSGLTKAGEQQEQSKKNMALKDVSKKHHIK